MILSRRKAACLCCIVLIPAAWTLGADDQNHSKNLKDIRLRLEAVQQIEVHANAPAETVSVETKAVTRAPADTVSVEKEAVTLAAADANRVERATIRPNRGSDPEPEGESRWMAPPKPKGLSFGAALILEYISNVSGGVEQDSAFLGNLDVTAELDTEEAGLWGGGTFFLYGLGNFNGGTVPTELVGDIQGTSNIEAPETFKLYEAWYSQSLLDDALSVLIGLHDFNSEFDVMEYAGVFANSSFGIGPQIAQVGPSIFPTTALALRIAAKPTTKSYVLAAIYDGVPGDPEDETSGAIKFDSGDGVFSALEIGLVPEEDSGAAYYKFAVGGWYRTSDIEDFEAEPQDSNGGVYLIAECQIYQEADDSQGLGVFGQFGTAMPDRSEVAYSIIAGLNYTGLIAGRDDDVLGIGVAHAALSDDFTNMAGNEELDSSETVIELVYQAPLTDWLAVQPDIQYIINPLSEPGLDDALQIGIRVEMGF